MNTEILNEFKQYLRQKYRKKWTIYSYYEFTKLFLQWINKPAKDITKEDLAKWKEFITQTYKSNGNLKRVISVNLFLRWLGKNDLKKSYPKPQDSNKIMISDKEILDYINASIENPLWYLITMLQIDGLLRPSEFSYIKISNIDFENDKLYLDDTKTGNHYIIMSPRVS
jgi:integrase